MWFIIWVFFIVLCKKYSCLTSSYSLLEVLNQNFKLHQMDFWFEFLNIHMNKLFFCCHDCHGFKWKNINIYQILTIFICSLMPFFACWIVIAPKHECCMSICVVYTWKLYTQLSCLNNALHSCLTNTNLWNNKFCMDLERTHETCKFVMYLYCLNIDVVCIVSTQMSYAYLYCLYIDVVCLFVLFTNKSHAYNFCV
jgi:hypothetical protein